MHKERAPAVSPHAVGRQVLVGELCPKAAEGRPGIAPLLMRTLQWSDSNEEVTNTVERGSTPRFAAFGVDGKVAGVFDTVGLADIAPGQSVASGTYVGGAPCSAEGGKGQPRTDDPACVAATHGCGLAVAQIARPDDPPEVPAYQTGAVCVSGDLLGVDIDGDGLAEWFPLVRALDGTRGPAQEWTAASKDARPCDGKFAAYDIKVQPETEAGKATDPKATVTFDVLGVLDLDGDGRKELVIAMRFPTVRTVVVFSAANAPQRLELVGEAQAFQH
ncbi:MAG TPA: hypothetical protein VFP84_25555 [Kofleriaceae bacterium]|nr:hypothetical protein [Kofleriaceae bacterium]